MTGTSAEQGTASPFLSLRGVSKRLGSTQALSDIELHVAPDELLVILGPTGAGKTTLLRTIAGLLLPDHGSIQLGETDITRWEPARRDVALVFQNFSLYPRWSVRKNLEFPLRAPGRNLTPTTIRERVDWAAELLQITRLLERDASRLSGGEMQRVAIGRAIVRRPRLFLMDEPLTNLDAKLREALRVELVELRRQLSTPMVFVTHDQAEALSMADRVVVLSKGRVLQEGTPRDIYARPTSPVVARQLGQPAINLIPVRRVNGHWTAADGTALITAEPSGPGERLLGIRPEDIVPEDIVPEDIVPEDIVPEPPGAEAGGPRPAGQDAEVELVEYLGPTTTLLCRWAGTRVHISLACRATFRPSDRLRLRVLPARAVLFDVHPDPVRLSS